MKTKLESLDDVRAERARLKNQLALSQVKMRKDITAIKTEINPARQAVGLLSDLLTTPKKGLLSIGVGVWVDMLLKRGPLARAGWLPRLVVPFIARNVATNLIYKNRTSLLEKALMWVKKKTEKKPDVNTEGQQKLLPPAEEVLVNAHTSSAKNHVVPPVVSVN